MPRKALVGHQSHRYTSSHLRNWSSYHPFRFRLHPLQSCSPESQQIHHQLLQHSERDLSVESHCRWVKSEVFPAAKNDLVSWTETCIDEINSRQTSRSRIMTFQTDKCDLWLLLCCLWQHSVLYLSLAGRTTTRSMSGPGRPLQRLVAVKSVRTGLRKERCWGSIPAPLSSCSYWSSQRQPPFALEYQWLQERL